MNIKQWFGGLFDRNKKGKVDHPDYRPLGRTGDIRYIPQIRKTERGEISDSPFLVYRLDDVQYEDLDRVRHYPTVIDGLDKFLAPLIAANVHFASGNKEAVALAKELLSPLMPELIRTLFKGAWEFGYQVVEPRWSWKMNVSVTLPGDEADGGDKTKVFPYVNVPRRFATFSPLDAIPLVNSRNGDFWGLRQLTATPITGQLNISKKKGKLIHFVLDTDYDTVLGQPRTKSALPFVEAVESVIDAMVLHSNLMAGGYKVGRYPEGAAPGRELDQKNTNRDLMKNNVEALESFSTMVLPSDTVSSNSDKYKWDLSIVMPPAGADAYWEKIDGLNGLIRLAIRMPEVASGGNQQEHGTYGLGEAQLDFFVKGLQGHLMRMATTLNDQFLYWFNVFNFGPDAEPLKCYFEELDIDSVRTLLAGLLEWLKGGEPLDTSEGKTIEVDWVKLAQDKGLPVRIRNTQDRPKSLADTARQQIAKRLGASEGPGTMPDNNANPDVPGKSDS